MCGYVPWNSIFHLTLLDLDEKTEHAENLATEAKALKQITFPEMDDDGLPSAYLPKVLGCLGKWQMKMHDLSGLMGESSEATMKPLLGWFSVMIIPVCQVYLSKKWHLHMRPHFYVPSFDLSKVGC